MVDCQKNRKIQWPVLHESKKNVNISNLIALAFEDGQIFIIDYKNIWSKNYVFEKQE